MRRTALVFLLLAAAPWTRAASSPADLSRRIALLRSAIRAESQTPSKGKKAHLAQLRAQLNALKAEIAETPDDDVAKNLKTAEDELSLVDGGQAPAPLPASETRPPIDRTLGLQSAVSAAASPGGVFDGSLGRDVSAGPVTAGRSAAKVAPSLQPGLEAAKIDAYLALHEDGARDEFLSKVGARMLASFRIADVAGATARSLAQALRARLEGHRHRRRFKTLSIRPDNARRLHLIYRLADGVEIDEILGSLDELTAPRSAGTKPKRGRKMKGGKSGAGGDAGSSGAGSARGAGGGSTNHAKSGRAGGGSGGGRKPGGGAADRVKSVRPKSVGPKGRGFSGDSSDAAASSDSAGRRARGGAGKGNHAISPAGIAAAGRRGPFHSRNASDLPSGRAGKSDARRDGKDSKMALPKGEAGGGHPPKSKAPPRDGAPSSLAAATAPSPRAGEIIGSVHPGAAEDRSPLEAPFVSSDGDLHDAVAAHAAGGVEIPSQRPNPGGAPADSEPPAFPWPGIATAGLGAGFFLRARSIRRESLTTDGTAVG
jgi:hypothetical protein